MMERFTWQDRYDGTYLDGKDLIQVEYDTVIVFTGEAVRRFAELEDKAESRKVNTQTFLPTCPVCESTMIAGENTGQEYCYKCGQKLHW